MTRSVFVLLLFSLLISNCSLLDAPYQEATGQTMGTTYSIVYQSRDNYKKEIDQLLFEINNEVSTYILSADISEYNQSDSVFQIKSESIHFSKNWKTSKRIFEETAGFFDPSVMPLINYWGFGYTEKKRRENVDNDQVAELMRGVGLQMIVEKKGQLIKPSANAQLDFSAIAKGHAVDEIARLLKSKGSENFLVEVGREVFAKGVSVKEKKWKVGLSTPLSEAKLDDISLVVELTNEGMASSGNYRNFYIVDGKKYGHTINPFTGYPSINILLGVAVIADDCISADAYATAMMAMGLEKASALVEKLNNVEACFFYGGEKGSINKKYSNGFIQYLPGGGK